MFSTPRLLPSRALQAALRCHQGAPPPRRPSSLWLLQWRRMHGPPSWPAWQSRVTCGAWSELSTACRRGASPAAFPPSLAAALPWRWPARTRPQTRAGVPGDGTAEHNRQGGTVCLGTASHASCHASQPLARQQLVPGLVWTQHHLLFGQQSNLQQLCLLWCPGLHLHDGCLAGGGAGLL